MSNDRSFWRNAAIICVVHVIVLGGVARWSSQATKNIPPDILWIDGGTAVSVASVPTAVAAPLAESDDESAPSEPERNPEALTAVKSDIELPDSTPEPVPTATPNPTPTISPKAVPSPSPKTSSKPSPKPSVKPKPSPSPKKRLIVKADATPSKKMVAEQSAEEQASETSSRIGYSPRPSTDVAAGAGGGQGGGRAGPSQVATYGRMLHDRFYKEWEQPTSVVAAGTKMSALARIRIERDGRVTGFNIIRPSGNVLVDESVAAVGRRVLQVEPLPGGLGGSHYEVNMNFELTLSQ